MRFGQGHEGRTAIRFRMITLQTKDVAYGLGCIRRQTACRSVKADPTVGVSFDTLQRVEGAHRHLAGMLALQCSILDHTGANVDVQILAKWSATTQWIDWQLSRMHETLNQQELAWATARRDATGPGFLAAA